MVEHTEDQDDRDKLASITLKGTKNRIKKCKLSPSSKFHAAKKPISPNKLNVIQQYFSKRVLCDTDDNRKSARHFHYCFNEALKQASHKQINNTDSRVETNFGETVSIGSDEFMLLDLENED